MWGHPQQDSTRGLLIQASMTREQTPAYDKFEFIHII